MNIWQYTSLKVEKEKEVLGGVAIQIYNLKKAWEAKGHTVYIGLNCPFKPEIIHTHGDFLPFPSKNDKKMKLAKWVHVFHGTSLGRMLACREFFSVSGYRGVAREIAICAQANAGIAVSQMAKEQAEKYYFFRKPVHVIPNGVNKNLYDRTLELTQDPIALFIGRSEDRVKNTDSLLKACDFVSKSHAGFKLWAAPKIESSAPYLVNLGPLPTAPLLDKMRQSRMLVLCSFYEGDPIVIHEAMGLGLPIVASKIPSIEALLSNYKNTYFIDPHSVGSITNAMNKVLSDLTIKAVEPVIRDWSQVAQEYVDFYSNLLK